jgi:hypothetical protein
MKHSTFYQINGQRKIYTTIKNTDHHKFLRDDHEGKTYLHEDGAPLYFSIGMPLAKPLYVIKEIA